MMLLLKKKNANTVLIITIVPLILLLLCLLLRPLAAFTVSLCEFYFGWLFEKNVLQLQKWGAQHQKTCSFCPPATLSTPSSSLRLATSSPGPLPYVSTLHRWRSFSFSHTYSPLPLTIFFSLIHFPCLQVSNSPAPVGGFHLLWL